MAHIPTCDDQRQHISLSKYAYDIVVNDSISFTGEKNISGYINKIVENTMTASIKALADAEYERLRTEYKKENLTDEEDEIFKRLAKAYMDSIINSRDQYPKDIALKIRLNNNVHKALYKSKYWDGRKKYNMSQGAYIKLLIERYARKTLFEREADYYKDEIKDLSNYIEQHKVLTITMNNGNQYRFKPYRFSNAYEANFNYLIGLSKPVEDEDAEYKSVSIRLYRIEDYKVYSDHGRITKDKKKEIEKLIEECGVAYLLTESQEFKIKLTKEGYSTYKKIYHQRPLFKGNDPKPNPDGTYDITINATDTQIENYFFQFRGEAIIMSPKKTRNKMYKWFKAGEERYKNSPDE